MAGVGWGVCGGGSGIVSNVYVQHVSEVALTMNTEIPHDILEVIGLIKDYFKEFQ